ncbi:MAG: hypothetical protein HQL87_07330 [Magnetococcales bacterium]|nr:hypothetical protein [Magnetococcales bacterium]
MFKKLQLTFHLLILYGLSGIFLLLLSVYCLFVIYNYNETIHAVEREQFALSHTVTEMARHQLDQVLRFNEVLLFARMGDREKFEVSNEKYVQAGKRLGDEILEGRNMAQKGMEMARSEAKVKEIDAIKTLLKGIEKAHGDYEHLGALLIRGIYQYDFLSKSESFASGGPMLAEEEANKHMAFLKGNISSLEDETRRLEGGIKDVTERVKQLSQTVTIDSERQRNQAFNSVLPLTFFSLASGLLWIFFMVRMQKEREQSRNKLTGQALGLLSDALTRLSQVVQEWEPASQQLERRVTVHRESLGPVVTDLQQLVVLADAVLALTEQMHGLLGEEQQALEQADLLVQQLNKEAKKLLETETETGRAIRHLRDTCLQINLLATNASAEACRSEATRSFAVFAEEIKELARANVLGAEAITNRTDDAILHIRLDQQHTDQACRRLAGVVELARKDLELFGKMVAMIQKQPGMLRVVQGTVVEGYTSLQACQPLLEQAQAARQAAPLRIKMAQEAMGGWPGVAG